MEAAEKDTISLEAFIEVEVSWFSTSLVAMVDLLNAQRHNLGKNLTPVTPETFAKWKQTRQDKKVAEEETLKAVDLARNGWELSLARKQLQEVRRLIHDGTQKPAWTKSLKMPAMVLVAMVVAFSVLMVVTK